MVQIESFSFLVLIFMAYLLVRMGFDANVFASIPKLLFTFCYPSLILVSLAALESDLSSQHIFFVIAFSVVSTFSIYLITQAALFRYKNELRREVIALYMVVGNVTFTGLPFLSYFFGPFGVSFAILFTVVQDFFIWSVGYARFSGKSNIKQSIKTILNPCFIAVIIGFIIAGSQWTIPGSVKLPVQMLADATIPLALICIGSLLAQNRGTLKAIDRDAILVVAAKTFLVPAIGAVLLLLIGVDIYLVVLCAFILCLPAPLIAILFAKEFDKDVSFANVIFVVSTLVFIFICVVLHQLQTWA